jgi:hypothetical protein
LLFGLVAGRAQLEQPVARRRLVEAVEGANGGIEGLLRLLDAQLGFLDRFNGLAQSRTVPRSRR